MSDKDDFPMWLAFSFIVFAFIMGIAAGSLWMVSEQHQVAIKHGVAEWVVDPQTGITTFHWKEKP